MSTQFTNRQWRLPNNENKDKQSNYSMDFDSASSDYIQIPYNVNLTPQNGNFTISAWINTDNLSGWHPIWCTQNLSSSTVPLVALHTFGNKVRATVGGSTNNPSYSGSWALLLDSTQSLTTSTWYHIAVTFNMSGNAQIYINGSADNSGPIENPQTSWDTGDRYIGEGEGYWDGQIDGVAIFNYALSSSQITTLYGSSSTGIGNPMSLSPKPVAFYQIGDKSAFNGANYLVPNIAAEEADGDIATSYSPYALDFDSASSDYISVGNDSSLDITGALTISFWIYGQTNATHNGVITKTPNTTSVSSNAQYHIQFQSSNQLRFVVTGCDLKAGTETTGTIPTVDVDSWQHFIMTWNGSNEMIVYKNGIEVATKTQSTTIVSNTSDLIIGHRLGYGYLDGSISNASIWNAELTSTQVTEIYNEGVPSNLNNHSAYSNLVSWWQLGSNSSFNTNWTVLDEVTASGNNGTSVNMTEADIVDGVGSYANGLSSGMGGDEVIGDAPYSSSNALSVNMDVEDRVTDTPS